jgi:agmatinase
MVATRHLCLVALPFEASTSFGKGTARGPDAIIEELDRCDAFDFDLACNPFRGLTRTIVRPHGAELSDAGIEIALAGRVVGDVLDAGCFALSLGGEHTVTLGPVRAARARGELGVVQLDAHADLRDAYEGNPLSHACVMRRVLEMDVPTLQLGIRSMSEPESRFAAERRLAIVDGRRTASCDDWYGLLGLLPKRVYLTIDIDVFDPADVPAVGTPEPGGPRWRAVTDFLEHLFAVKDVVAADVVELMPGPGDEASVRLAARLVGRIAHHRFQG